MVMVKLGKQFQPLSSSFVHLKAAILCRRRRIINKQWAFITIILSLFLLFQSVSVYAKVTASTGRTVISIDETIVLEIKSENSSGSPELTELEDSFQILGQGQSQNYSLINGQASRTHTWNITLLPKRTGELTIPAIKVGNETTNEIHLVVQKQSKTPAIDGKEVFLKISISGSNDETKKKDTYYVQQQIMVSVKLFHRIRFSNATLSELTLPNTVVEKLGNDANYSKTISNHRYNIIERHYAIYPQQSGELTVPALTFSGNAEISQNFSLFSRPGRQIISRTKPFTLNILPVPKSYTGQNWLPAESLKIESEIIEDINSITEGEAITRKIVVRARGLLGSQLPATSVNSSSRIKTYPDKEKMSNQLVNSQVVGVRQDTVAIIPLKAGPFTLPAIEINWWNTQTNQQETASLAEQTFFAKKNSDVNTDKKTQTATALPSVKENVPAPKPVKTAQQSTETIEKFIYKDVALRKNIWFWISVGLFILWLITLSLFFLASAKNKKLNLNKLASETTNKYHKNYLQAVYDACLENDANKANLTLIQWSRFYYKQPMLPGISALIQLVDDQQLNQAINNLESSLYSKDKHNWDGRALITALQQCIEQDKAHENNSKKAQAFANLKP